MRLNVLWLTVCAASLLAADRGIAQEKQTEPRGADARRDLWAKGGETLDLTVGIDKGDLVGDTNVVIQRAVDIVSRNGGGTVTLGPGVYTCYGSVRMKSNVRLVGAGPETILRRCAGPASPLSLDADCGETKVTVKDASGFREGMDVTVGCDGISFWIVTTATVTFVKGNTIYLDKRLLYDYPMGRNANAYSGFSVIDFTDVSSSSVERLTVDGNRSANHDPESAYLSGISMREARDCRVSDCALRDTMGDGFVCAMTHDITVENCQALRNQCFGIHFGAGSARPIARGNTIAENAVDGLYLCYRVQDGRFDNNDIHGNGQHGISIGHKDTDNVFVGNKVHGNKQHGIYFRRQDISTAGNRNAFRENVIQNNGKCGVYVEAHAVDLLFERNTIGDTRPSAQRTQRIGIFAAPGTDRIRCIANTFGDHLTAATQGKIENNQK